MSLIKIGGVRSVVVTVTAFYKSRVGGGGEGFEFWSSLWRCIIITFPLTVAESSMQNSMLK